MKKIFFTFLCAGIALLAGCSKDDEQANITVYLKNTSGQAVAQKMIYEFSTKATDEYGSNPKYANKRTETDGNGVAVFTVDGFEFKNNANTATLYFTVFKEITSTTGYTVTATDSITIEKGKSYKKELILNQ